MGLHIYMYIYIYTYISIYLYAHTRLYLCFYTLCMFVCVWTCIYIIQTDILTYMHALYAQAKKSGVRDLSQRPNMLDLSQRLNMLKREAALMETSASILERKVFYKVGTNLHICMYVYVYRQISGGCPCGITYTYTFTYTRTYKLAHRDQLWSTSDTQPYAYTRIHTHKLDIENTCGKTCGTPTYIHIYRYAFVQRDPCWESL
jgi:hypothetical protein